jgi:hypothetical protein
MQWYREKPKKPGWYWWQPVPNYAEIVLIKQGFVYEVGKEKGKQLGNCPGQWCGPISTPDMKLG